jgi:hypothetical protein
MTAVVLAATALVLLLFVPLLSVDLRLDELGSYWVVKDDLRAVFDRSFEVQGQSPLYYVVLWSTAQVFGVAPWALRLPSLIFTWLSSLVAFRLGAFFGGRALGLLSVFGFLLCSQLQPVAIEARPYALAILFASTSTLLFLRWLSAPGIVLGALYSLTAVMTVYAHYLFGYVLCVHLVCFCLQFTREKRERRRALISGGIVIGVTLVVLLLPCLKHLCWLFSKGSVPSFAQPPTLLSVLKAFIPLDVVLVLIVISIFRLTVWRKDDARFETASSKGPVLAVISLILVPPLALLAASLFSGHSLWVGRYYSAQCLGIGMATGLILSTLPTFPRQMTILAVVLTIRLATQYALTTKENSGEGWGEALRTLGADDPTQRCLLLDVPGFVESRLLGKGSSGVLQGFMSAPLIYHQVSNETALIPFSFDGEDARRYFRTTVLPSLARAPCAWLLYWNVDLYSDPPVRELSVAWLKRKMPEFGFAFSYAHRTGLVDVVRYERKTSLGSADMPDVRQDLGSFSKNVSQ